MLSPVRLSVCRLSVCNVRAPYSGGSNFRQYFYGIRYLGHLLTSTENFTEIVSGEPLRPARELNTRGVAKYSDFGPIDGSSRSLSHLLMSSCFSGVAGSTSNSVSRSPRSTSVPSGSLMQPFGHSRRGPKIGGSAPFGVGAGSPSNTKSPGLGSGKRDSALNLCNLNFCIPFRFSSAAIKLRVCCSGLARGEIIR